MDRSHPTGLPRSRAVLVLVAVVLTLVAGDATPASACSCAPLPPPETAVSEADAVFVGEVIDVRDAGPGTRVATLAVTEVHAGEVSEEVEVRTPADSAACGHAFEPGREELVYAVLDDDGVLDTNLCDRTAPLSDAADDLAALGAGSEPARDGRTAADPTDPDDPLVPQDPDVPGPDGAADTSGDEPAGPWVGLALVAAAIAAVIAVTVLVQRRRRA